MRVAQSLRVRLSSRKPLQRETRLDRGISKGERAWKLAA